MRTTLVFLLMLASCGTVPPEDPQPSDKAGPSGKAGPSDKTGSEEPDRASPPTKPGSKADNPEKKPGLPAGFAVRGSARIQVLSLPPAAMWRFLVSRLTTLRADARASGQDLLVTFRNDVVHVTDRAGGRHSWRLPAGLVLAGGPVHLLLGADLSTRVFDSGGTQAPAAEEITVVTAKVAGAEGAAEEYRLVIKGGHAFRSISTSG